VPGLSEDDAATQFEIIQPCWECGELVPAEVEFLEVGQAGDALGERDEVIGAEIEKCEAAEGAERFGQGSQPVVAEV
jgi:hypothetical protein